MAHLYCYLDACVGMVFWVGLLSCVGPWGMCLYWLLLFGLRPFIIIKIDGKKNIGKGCKIKFRL